MITTERKLDQLKQKFPNDNIDTVEIFEINGRKLFNRKQISEILSLSIDRVKDYEAKGLPRSEFSTSSYILYDLKETIDWIILNISAKHSKRGKAAVDDGTVEIDKNNWAKRKEKASALKEEASAKLESLKAKEAEGKLVTVEETDIAMAELGAVYVSDYRDDLKLLPVILENKSLPEITELLDRHYQKRVEEKAALAKSLIQVKKPTIYEKFKEFIEEDEKEDEE